MSAILRTEGLTVRFGGVTAVDSVDLEVGQGELVGLIGPNGAGKTSLIEALTGFAPCAGTVRLGDRSLNGISPHRRARLGLARTWQAADLFEDLTVRENLNVAANRAPLWRASWEALSGGQPPAEAVDAVLEELGIAELAEREAHGLTEGQRKLVGVARALVLAPKALCLDEPAAGLDSGESRELGAELRRIVDRGIAMLLVDHDMGLVLSICDRVVVLEFGKVIAAGTPDEIRRDPRVVQAYLGKAADEVLTEVEG